MSADPRIAPLGPCVGVAVRDGTGTRVSSPAAVTHPRRAVGATSDGMAHRLVPCHHAPSPGPRLPLSHRSTSVTSKVRRELCSDAAVPPDRRHLPARRHRPRRRSGAPVPPRLPNRMVNDQPERHHRPASRDRLRGPGTGAPRRTRVRRRPRAARTARAGVDRHTTGSAIRPRRDAHAHGPERHRAGARARARRLR